jgi:hypothetical protein
LPTADKKTKPSIADRLEVIRQEAKTKGFAFRYVERRIGEAMEEFYLYEFEQLEKKKAAVHSPPKRKKKNV